MKKVLFAVLAVILIAVTHASAATNQYRIMAVNREDAGFRIKTNPTEGPGFLTSAENVEYLMKFFGVKKPEEMIGKSFDDEGNFDIIYGAETTFRKIIARERQGKKYVAPTEDDVLSETALQLATLQCPKFDNYYPEDARPYLDKVLAFHTKDNKWYYDEAEHKLATDKLVEKVKTVSDDRVEVKEVTEEYATSEYFALRCPARYFVVTRKATSEKLNVALCQDDFVCLK